ncbi:MAG: peptidase M50 [Planctomycetes bacterium GWF2_50_10]|nr:MAG: peptidase M50 [Planctomycetes bacterium GWF2_50_10]
MFGKTITLFKMFGFAVRIDISWIVIAVLITWSLAKGLFPTYYPPAENPQFTTSTYWLMGIGGMAGLFVSIVFHELCHSLVAKRYGLPMKGITLFIFGGVAEMSEEPPSPKAEFLMAIAGPASSVGLAVLFYIVSIAARQYTWPSYVGAVFGYLAIINLVLVVFNMLPGFPLDGGRVLRSILWYWKGNIRWATKVASGFGSSLGIMLIVLGVLSVISSNFIGGMWYFLIGLFLKNAANMSYQQIIIRESLGGWPVTKFMKRDVITVEPDMTVEDMVDKVIYKYHHNMYPVVSGGRLVGCVSVKNVRSIPRGDWPIKTVRDIAQQCGETNTVSPQIDAMAALGKMNELQVSRLMVVDGGRLAGIISLRDMLKFLSMKTELEES